VPTEADRIEAWDARYGGSDRHVTPDGVELYHELRGEGPTVTVVSNFFVVSVAWRPFTTRLIENHRVLTYDLRNQGASTGASAALEDHISDLRSLLDALGIEQTYLLGHSVSTQICRDFAVAEPDRVKGLILCAPTVSPWGVKRRRYILRSWARALEEGGPAALFDTFYPLVFSERMVQQGGTPAYLALKERFVAVSSLQQLRLNIAGALEGADKGAPLSEIPCPTLVLSGDEDFLNSTASLTAVADLIPDARVEVLPSAGHTPYFESPDAFQDAIAGFVDSVERG
jgi:3-oxoadipate enol-lactonase